ncbi:MAG: carbohydrate kinase [Clostridia bacterium]|nr:carbohydrate kinase [Clostridia bacterium]
MKTVCVGENLVDTYITENGETAVPGGAPLNVACYLSSMGFDSYIITSVSTDKYGEKILNTIEKYGVKKDMIVYSELPSSKSVVTINSTGDRSFRFEKEGTAGFTVSKEDIDKEKLKGVSLVHFCTVSLFNEKMREATEKVLSEAVSDGAIISYDLNIRNGLFDSEKKQKETALEFLKYADMIKLTDEELEFITGTENTEEALKTVFKYASNAKVVFLTLGENGSYAYSRNLESAYQPAEKIQAVDTLGAGDMFSASCIKYILGNGFKENAKGYSDCLKTASINASEICLKKGAL